MSDKVAWRRDFEVRKLDEDKHLVFGWANIAVRKDGVQVLDTQQDLIDIEDLEAAAYRFNLAYRETGEMHEGTAKGEMVESFVVTSEKLAKMGLPPDGLPLGWWVGFYVDDDEAFAKVKSGDYKMFSIQGSARREEV